MGGKAKEIPLRTGSGMVLDTEKVDGLSVRSRTTQRSGVSLYRSRSGQVVVGPNAADLCAARFAACDVPARAGGA